MRTQIDIDGNRWCLLKTPDINIHLSIDLSIYLSTEGLNGGRDTSLGQHTGGHIDRTERNETSTGRMVAITDRTQYQQYQLS